MTRRRAHTASRVRAALAALVLWTACEPAPAPGSPSSDARLREVASAGAQVMPFDLERSTHVFADTDWGGEQRVVSDDGDVAQVALIRGHLAEEAARFARGDFTSPERIHGRDMPGLDALRENAAALEVTYAAVEQGGAITYRTQDPRLRAALHAWFAAQRSDHGAHAAH